MASINVLVHLANVSLGDVQSISIVTTTGNIQMNPKPASGSGPFSTAHAEAMPGNYCVLVELPGLVSFPGPVDDPKQTK